MFAPYGFNPVPTTDGTPADQQTARPEPGETVGPQGTVTDYPGWFGWACANGGTAANPCGFPNYGNFYAGSYATYSFMLQHPIIRHARSQVFDPIIASDWGYEAKEGTPDEVIAFVRDQLEPLRVPILRDALRAVDYGWAGFEKVWDIVGGQYVLKRLKPLNVRTTQILGDKNGNFAGLRWNGKREDDLDVHKSWLFTYDSEFGDLYGRSRLENIRGTAWRDWLDAATDLYKLSQKLSGIMPVIYTPTGDVLVAGGVTRSWRDLGNEVLQKAKQGVGVHLYHMGALGAGGRIAAGQANFDQLMELIKVSAVRLDVIDFGDNAPAIAGILDRMRHDEELMFAGYLRSPRTGMESKHGSRADAQQHTDTADTNSENLSGDIGSSLNCNVVDDILALRYGDEAKGSVRIVPAKLSDENLAVDNKILDAIFNNADGLGTDYLTKIDIDAITERRGIPKLDDAPIVLEVEPQDDGSLAGGLEDTIQGDNAGQ